MHCATCPGLQHDVGAERLQHVGAARFRRHRAPAVLRDARAGGRGDEHRRGRDVERMRRVAAGADDVDQMLAVRHLDPGREFAHHLRRGGDLADRLLLDPQADGQRRDHHRRHFAAHDPAHDRQHLVGEDLPVLDRAVQRFLDGDGHGGSGSVGYLGSRFARAQGRSGRRSWRGPPRSAPTTSAGAGAGLQRADVVALRLLVERERARRGGERRIGPRLLRLVLDDVRRAARPGLGLLQCEHRLEIEVGETLRDRFAVPASWHSLRAPAARKRKSAASSNAAAARQIFIVFPPGNSRATRARVR